jgi:hypothetical protein
MESVFYVVSFGLLAAAVATFIAIVQEVAPFLSTPDRDLLRAIGSLQSQLRARDYVLNRAWRMHVERFPDSRKRQLFAVLLIGAAMSVFGYTLWTTFR